MSESKRRPVRYPDEERERAVRMVFDHGGEYPSQWKAIGPLGGDRLRSAAGVDDR